VPYLLLNRFQALFNGVVYRHRDSSLGDSVAVCLPEDLYALRLSQKLTARIQEHDRIVNAHNTVRGINARRGDGTFGERIPHTTAVALPGFGVGRGLIATVEIGTEVKILAKAMIKQIDRSDQTGHAIQARGRQPHLRRNRRRQLRQRIHFL